MTDFSNAFALGTIADIVFSVGGEDILAHKFILYFRSPVFATMFNGPMAPKSENGEKPVIKIDDARISADDFKTFLKFLYCNKVEVTGENVFPLLNMGKMYDVQSLVQFCEEFLIDNLNSDNVFIVANSSIVFHDSEIFTTAINFIVTKTDVLESEEFCQMNVEVLSNVLKMEGSDHYCYKHYIEKDGDCTVCGKIRLFTEIELFQMLLKWGSSQCKIQELEENPENMKKILEPFLPSIRFPTMSIEELTTVVYPTKLLDDSALITVVVAAQDLNNDRFASRLPFRTTSRGFFAKKKEKKEKIHLTINGISEAGKRFCDFKLGSDPRRKIRTPMPEPASKNF